MENNIIKIGLVEYSTHMVVHKKMELDITQYPELAGMVEAQVLEYIKENAHEMKPMDDNRWFDNLHDELMDMAEVRDKVYNCSTDIYND